MSDKLIMKEEYFPEEAKVIVSGEIDIFTAQQFKDKLYSALDGSGKSLIIDCSDLKYIDSTGLGIFVGALKKSKLTGKNIYLENIRDNIKKLFNITGLDKLFIIH